MFSIMRVILLKDVAKVGQKFDVKDVADGYAINFLIPRGLVEAATEANVRKVEGRKKKEDTQRKVQQDLILKNIADLGEVIINIKAESNEKGHLFAGIHKEEISKVLKEQSRLDIPPQFINLEKPIKEIGEHLIEVQFEDKKTEFKLNILSA